MPHGMPSFCSAPVLALCHIAGTHKHSMLVLHLHQVPSRDPSGGSIESHTHRGGGAGPGGGDGGDGEVLLLMGGAVNVGGYRGARGGSGGEAGRGG